MASQWLPSPGTSSAFMLVSALLQGYFLLLLASVLSQQRQAYTSRVLSESLILCYCQSLLWVHHGSFRLSIVPLPLWGHFVFSESFTDFLALFPFFDATLWGTTNLSPSFFFFFSLIFSWSHPWYYWVVWGSFNSSDTFLLWLSLFCTLWGRPLP